MQGFCVKKFLGLNNLSRTRISKPHTAPTKCSRRGWIYSHSHRLSRHDGEVLGRREVRQPEGVPEHDVGVGDAGVWRGGDPRRQALRGLAGGLGHVAAGRVELVVRVCGVVLVRVGL